MSDQPTPTPTELLFESTQSADVAAGRFADDLHDPYAETLLHEASTLALQSIAASLLRVVELLEHPAFELLEQPAGITPLPIRRGAQPREEESS